MNKQDLKEMLDFAGVDTTKGKAKALIEATDTSSVDKKYSELLKDKRYMDELVSDMLSSEGKDDTPKNRKDALSRAKGTYLRNIAKDQINS